MRKLKKFLVYTSAFLALHALLKECTDDFSPSHLVKASQDPKWDVPFEGDILPILKQKYTYLGRGLQAYVFLAEDGKHVLKVFKPDLPTLHCSFFGKRHKLGLSKIPLAQDLFLTFFPESGTKQREKDFQSYVNAYTLLPKETALTYLHLTKSSHLQHKLELYDKIGVKQLIDLDQTCFLVQKRADLLYDTLQGCIDHKEEEKAKELISTFVDLSFRFWETGIFNPTTLKKNFGCIGSQAIQIDVGRILTKHDLQKEEPPSLEQVRRSTSFMQRWLTERDPHLATYLENLFTQRREHYETKIL